MSEDLADEETVDKYFSTPVKKKKLVIKYSCPMCRAVHDKDHVFIPHPAEKELAELKSKITIMRNWFIKYHEDIDRQIDDGADKMYCAGILSGCRHALLQLEDLFGEKP